MPEKEKDLMNRFEQENPGKHAIWHGKATKGYENWKMEQLNKSRQIISTRKISKRSDLPQIQHDIKRIFSILENLEQRLRTLETGEIPSKNKTLIEEISSDQFFRFLTISYNTIDKKFGDFVPISILTENLKHYIPWNSEKIHSEIYRLFMEYKIDLQSGKKFKGEPLRQDGKTFVWFKFK